MTNKKRTDKRTKTHPCNLIDRDEATRDVYDKDIGMLTQWDIGRNNGR